MKNMRKLIAVITVAGVLGTAGAVFAAAAKTPAEVAAGLTGKTIEELYQVRAAGKTYGTIAKDAGKLDEFKAQMLEQKKAILDQRVEEGTLTQQQADEIYETVKDNQAACDGTGNAQPGKKYGAGFGSGAGRGQGMDKGKGRGAGLGNGSCIGIGAGNGLNQ